MNEAVEPLADDLRMLLLLGQAAAQERHPDRIALWVTEGVSALLNASLGAVVLTPTSDNGRTEVHGELESVPIDDGLRTRLGSLATATADRRSGGVAVVERLGAFPELVRRGVAAVLRCEIRTLQRSFGVLVAGFPASPSLNARERFVLGTLANQAAVALENARERQELERALAELTPGGRGDAVPEPNVSAARRQPLVATKVQAPQPPTAFVRRPRLHATLDEGTQRKLTLIEAPTGSGKTVLIAGWLAERQPRFGWLSLDDEDADPSRFWTYVDAALRQAIPHLPCEVLESAQIPGGLGAEFRMAPFVNALADSDEPVILVLDGYEVVDAPTVHEDMRLLLRHLPAALRLVILTRSEPPLPIRELRARGELTEITATDLRFTREEAAELLNDAMEANLSDEHVGTLLDHAEGWPAILHLVGTSLRHRGDRGAFTEAVSADAARFVDSLVSSVLDGLPRRVRTFARRATVLDVLTPTLCEAVTGFDDTEELLAKLEQSGLVALPAAGEGASRFHPRFRQALVRELERSEPDLLPNLHHRAATCYRERGETEHAVDHLLAAGDHTEAAVLLRRHWVDLVTEGQAPAVEGRLRALPDAVLRGDPSLSLARGWTALHVGNLDDAEAWFDVAAEAGDAPGADVATADAGSVASSVARGRAMCAFLHGDVKRLLEHSEHVLALEADESSFGWIAARATWGLGLYWEGRSEEARRALMEVAWAAPGCGHHPAALLARGHLAALNADEGATGEASKHIRYALDLAAEHGLRDHFWLAAVHTTQARLLERQGRLATAAAEADRSVGLGRRGAGRIETAHALGVLARIRARQGERDEAAKLLADAQALRGRCAEPGLLTEKLDDIRVAVDASTERGGPAAGQPVTERELAVLRLLPSKLSQREIARELYVSYNTVKTHVRSLYQKLGAAAREEAVDRARESGLLR